MADGHDPGTAISRLSQEADRIEAQLDTLYAYPSEMADDIREVLARLSEGEREKEGLRNALSLLKSEIAERGVRLSEYEQALRGLREAADIHGGSLVDWRKLSRAIDAADAALARAALSGSAGPDKPKADTGGRGFPASSGTALASQVAQCVDAAGEAHERGDAAGVYEQVRNIAWVLLAHDGDLGGTSETAEPSVTEPGLPGSAGSGP